MQSEKTKDQPSTRYQKILVSYLYFIQGIFLAIPATTTLTYQQMPSYAILGLFSFAVLPFSFKFISAPFIEKYTSISYGRRKTWIIISFVGASLMLFMATLFTEQTESDQQRLAFLLTGVIFMVSLEDISTDALAVKELNDAALTSYLQCVFQLIGTVVGGILYLQLVSGSLYKILGFSQPFLTRPQFFSCISGVVLASSIVIHISYKQKLLQEQTKNSHTFCQVILHYRYFVMPKYMLCRRGLTFVLYMHGLNYFFSSYLIELIKNNHISKDELSFLSNVMMVPVLILLSVLKRCWTDGEKNSKRTRWLYAIRLAIAMAIFVFQIQSWVAISICYALFYLLAYAQFYINSVIINSVADAEYSGMFVTMMASLCNFGNNTTIQLKIIDWVGYWNATVFGFVYTGAVVAVAGRVEKWVKMGLKKGEDVQTQIHEKKEA